MFANILAVRGANEERQAVRRRWTAAAIGATVAALALVALALSSPGGQAKSSSLALKAGREARAHTRATHVKLALHHATSKLWTRDSANSDSSTERVAVSEDDISNLGLRAPSGFNVPSVNVSGDDVSRYPFATRLQSVPAIAAPSPLFLTQFPFALWMQIGVACASRLQRARCQRIRG